MNHQIEVDDDVYERLGTLARPFVDTPNSVLRRVLEIDAAETVEASGERHTPTRLTEEKTVNRKPGKVTPQKEFRPHIRAILREAGGSLPMEKVLDEVERRMESRYVEADYGHVTNGEVRWRNAARWERNQMVKDGLIKKTERWGVWELTSEGMKDD